MEGCWFKKKNVAAYSVCISDGLLSFPPGEKLSCLYKHEYLLHIIQVFECCSRNHYIHQSPFCTTGSYTLNIDLEI